METRPLPEITWENLRPPYDWWDFFKEADHHSFRFDAASFDIRNAWWLIEASTLAYSNPAFVQERFTQVGLTVVRSFDGHSTQCFVASNDDFIIVVFRGTELRLRSANPGFMDIMYDILADVQIWLEPFEGGGMVHNGFKKAVEEVWQDCDHSGVRVTGLRSYLDELSTQKNRPIWFTGHSLGAAVATLAADLYGTGQGLYTFGSPRVGDLEFRNNFSLMSYRFVNGNDIVTRVPLEGPYQHVGSLRFINAAHRIVDEAASSEPPVEIIPDALNDILEVAKKLKPETLLSVPSWLLDHVPVLYSTHIWNNYIQNL
jgi:triacylglycerol lipase